jgi:hypothetical protein
MWKTIYHEFRRWAKISRRGVGVREKTEITVETEQLWIIQKSHASRGWCADCGREVDMVRLSDAVLLSDKGTPALPGPPSLPDPGHPQGWHGSRAADGTMMICLDSLRKSK